MKRQPFIWGLTVVLAFAIVNYVASRHFARIDLTANRAYTLAEITKTTLRALPDIITIHAFVSDDLPPQLLPAKQALLDMLREYEHYSGANFSLLLTDPGASEDAKREALLLGVSPFQANVVKHDKQEMGLFYLGLAVQYGDKKEVLPIDPRDPAGHLEEWLTGAIVKLTRAESPKLGWWAPTDAPEGQGFEMIYKYLQDHYDVETLAPPHPLLTPDHIATLVVVAPHNVSAAARDAIAAYLAQGGKVFLLLNRISIDAGYNATPYPTGLEDLLTQYGVTIPATLVADAQSNIATFQSQMFAVTAPYAFWPLMKSEELNRAHPAVSALDVLTLPWASPITLANPLPAGISATVLAHSSPKSLTLAGQPPFSLDPDTAAETIQDGDFTGNFPLAVSLDGDFAGTSSATTTANTTTPTTHHPATLAIVGTAHLLEDRFVGQRQFTDGVAFFANMLDHLTVGDALIGIRSRPISSRMLDANLTDTKRDVIKYSIMVGIPLLVCVGGLLVWWQRQRRVARVRERYAA